MVELIAAYSGQDELARLADRVLTARRVERPVRVPSRRHKLSLRISDDMTDEIARRYEAGESMPALARSFGLGKGTVVKVLHEAGVSIRRRGLTPAQVIEAKRLYAPGLSLEAVGRRIGANHSSVGTAMQREGIALRSPQWGRWHRPSR